METAPFWTSDADSMHQTPEQRQRQNRAALIPIDPRLMDTEGDGICAAIGDYAVSLESCTCRDFALHGKPCKHMYRLAHEAQLFDLKCTCVYGPYPSKVQREQFAKKLAGRLSIGKDCGYLDGFAWAVPRAFSEAVAECDFRGGDVLYDSRDAYSRPWREALHSISHSIQVKAPEWRPAGNTTSDLEQAVRRGSFARNWGKTVMLSLMDHSSGQTQLIPSTQGRLYMLLWTGDVGWLNNLRNMPKPPSMTPVALKELLRWAEIGDYTHLDIPCIPDCCAASIFMMPYDDCRSASRVKAMAVSAALSGLGAKLWFVAPADIDISPATALAPTISIACYAVRESGAQSLLNALERALYRGSTVDGRAANFSINRHGCLITTETVECVPCQRCGSKTPRSQSICLSCGAFV